MVLSYLVLLNRCIQLTIKFNVFLFFSGCKVFLFKRRSFGIIRIISVLSLREVPYSTKTVSSNQDFRPGQGTCRSARSRRRSLARRVCVGGWGRRREVWLRCVRANDDLLLYLYQQPPELKHGYRPTRSVLFPWYYVLKGSPNVLSRFPRSESSYLFYLLISEERPVKV